jgi:hypothetical protein
VIRCSLLFQRAVRQVLFATSLKDTSTPRRHPITTGFFGWWALGDSNPGGAGPPIRRALAVTIDAAVHGGTPSGR